MDRKKLSELLVEYEHSLTRAEGERELQANLAMQAQAFLDIDKKHFVALAKARHKDVVNFTHDDLQKQVDLFDLAINEIPPFTLDIPE